jgi:predicted metalloendopeptidase
VAGSKTLDENMADFGGTKIAHKALLAWQEQATGTRTTVAGERLFFTSFAQLWCEKGRRASLQVPQKSPAKEKKSPAKEPAARKSPAKDSTTQMSPTKEPGEEPC